MQPNAGVCCQQRVSRRALLLQLLLAVYTVTKVRNCRPTEQSTSQSANQLSIDAEELSQLNHQPIRQSLASQSTN
jgi:hypothetical protein